MVKPALILVYHLTLNRDCTEVELESLLLTAQVRDYNERTVQAQVKLGHMLLLFDIEGGPERVIKLVCWRHAVVEALTELRWLAIDFVALQLLRSTGGGHLNFEKLSHAVDAIVNNS